MNILSSHVLMLGLTVLLVILMIFSIKSMSDQWSEFSQDIQKDQVCTSIREAIEEIYNQSDYSTNSTLGIEKVVLPEKLAGSSYDIIFNNSISIISKEKTYTCPHDLHVVLKGSAKSDSVTLTYHKINNENIVEIG